MSNHLFGMRIVPLLCALWSGTAIAETKISADVSVEGGYASNPFLTAGGNSGSATLTASVQPRIIFEDATNTFSLSGNLGRTVYSRGGTRGNEIYSVNGSYVQQLSPRSSFNLSAGFSQSVQNALQPIVTSLPIPDLGVNILDPSAIENLGQTIRTYSASAGFTTSLSSRTSLSLQGFGNKVQYPNGRIAQDYAAYGGGINLSYALNDRISLGPSVSYSRSDYENTLFGSSSQVSPTLLVNVRFPSRIRLNVTGGVTLSSIDQAGISTNKTSLAASANLCRDGNRSTLCVDARQSTSPTAFSGLSNVRSVGASYSYKLTPRSSLGANANYSHTRTLDNSAIIQTLSYGSAGANYSRQLTQRLSFTVKALYTKSFEAIVAQRSNIYGGVSISYGLGRRS